MKIYITIGLTVRYIFTVFRNTDKQHKNRLY